MDLDESKTLKEALQDEYNKNLKTIELSEERTKLATENRTEYKLGTILSNSILSYLFLYLITIISTAVLGPETITNVIPAFSIPTILTTSSLGIGYIVNKINQNKINLEERINNFSLAQTEAEKIEEQIYYEIELEKAKNRNEAIKYAIDDLSSDRTILYHTVSRKYKTNQTVEEAKQKLDELILSLEQKYHELDILSTQKVLSEKFLRVRKPSQIKIDKFLIPLVSSFTTYYFTTHILSYFDSVIAYSSPLTSLLPVLIPILGGGIVSSLYWKKRTKDQTTAFNNLNETLDKDRLANLKENIFKECMDLKYQINSIIIDIKRTIIEIQKQISILENLEPEVTIDEMLEPTEEKIITVENTQEPQIDNDSLIREQMKTFYISEEPSTFLTRRKVPNTPKKRI